MKKKLKYHFVFLLLLQIGLCFLYGYHKTYKERPYSIHQWRQTDCASFAKNYYEEGMHFFSPTIHWQGNQQGKTISEFPLVNYSVACLYKVFGEHEFLYRFTVFGIYLISVLFLFAMVFIVSNSLFYSYFSVSLISTSPLIAYYSFSFLADMPALSFAIISLSFFVFFLKSNSKYQFVLALVFAVLAVLLKASSATVLLIIITVTLINSLKFPKYFSSERISFKYKLTPIVFFIVSFAIIYSWYHYAFLYNNENSNGVFLLETLPIWKMEDKVLETARLLYNVQFAMFFNKGVLIFISIILGWLLLNLKKIRSFLQISLLIALASFIGFIVLFYQVFNVHDYYLINSMILPVIVLVCLGDYLKPRLENITKKVMIFVSMIILTNAVYCATIIRLRNINKDVLCEYSPFITNEEKNFSDWFHYNYSITLKPFETITPYLRSLGINRTDKVISLPDPSFNITLYLMDQKGFTETEMSLNNDIKRIQNDIDLGAKYLILSDSSLIHKTYLNNYLNNPIGKFENVLIYKIN
jgi:hypothetical protein